VPQNVHKSYVHQPIKPVAVVMPVTPPTPEA
jgi:hypothetical protein